MSEIVQLYPSDEKPSSDKPIVHYDYTERDEKIILNITFIFPCFTILDAGRKDDEKWKSIKEVKISGTGYLSEDSKPLLPSFKRFVQIPPGYDVVDGISFVKNNRMEELNDILITWDEDSATDEGWEKFDEKIYDTDEYIPGDKDIVRKAGPIYMDGYKTLLIEVRPLQHNPKRKLLTGYGKITVTIPLSPVEIPEKKKREELALTDGSTNLEAFGNHMINPRRKAFENVQVEGLSASGSPPEDDDAEFLVFYDKKFKDPVEMLRKWKTGRGIHTETAEIQNSNDEGNKIKWIKERIRERRRKPNSKLRYVLLFGDIDTIPLSLEAGQGEGATDHYFYTHKDAGDGECLLPWVSGGRIPVETKKEGIAVVERIIRYEKGPPDNPDYFKRMTFAAYFQDSEDADFQAYRDGRAERNFLKTMEEIWTHMESKGIKPSRAYFSHTLKTKEYLYRDGTKVPDYVKKEIIAPKEQSQQSTIEAENAANRRVIELINQGPRIVGHRGHGVEDGWRHPPFRSPDLTSISNDYPCVLFSINCSTGDFGNPERCFSEHALVLQKTAASIIAATAATNTWRNDSLIKALFDGIWPGIFSNFPDCVKSYEVKNRRLGDLLNYAKSYLLVKHGANTETKTQFELYHVIGDPTLEVWKV